MPETITHSDINRITASFGRQLGLMGLLDTETLLKLEDDFEEHIKIAY